MFPKNVSVHLLVNPLLHADHDAYILQNVYMSQAYLKQSFGLDQIAKTWTISNKEGGGRFR